MSEQYSEDAKHIEKLYEVNERLRESTDKSLNVQDYKGIIELSKTSIKTKQLGAQLIPRYFKFFTSLATKAFDAYMDIIDEVDVGVRVQAIHGLPLFSKDTPEFISKIVDVLVQCLNTEELVERDAVHGAFMALSRQDTRASLTALFKHTEANPTTDDQIRENVLHFIRDKVFPLKGELLKPQAEMERYITDLIKKSLEDVTGEEFNMFMNFLKSLSIFGGKAPQERMQELVEIVEGQADLDTQFDVSDTDHINRYISCLQIALPFFAAPNATNSLCGYKIVTGQPSDRLGEDFSELYKEFTERLTSVEDLTKATIKELDQKMLNHYNDKSAAKTYEDRSSVALHAKTPSFSGDNGVTLSWITTTKALASTTGLDFRTAIKDTIYTDCEVYIWWDMENIILPSHSHLPASVVKSRIEKSIRALGLQGNILFEAVVGLRERMNNQDIKNFSKILGMIGVMFRNLRDGRKQSADQAISRDIHHYVSEKPPGVIVIISCDGGFIDALEVATLKNFKTIILGRSGQTSYTLRTEASLTMAWEDIIAGITPEILTATNPGERRR